MRYLILAVFLLAFPQAARATECASAWVSADQVQGRLICARNEKGGMETGLELRLTPQWHTYWRTPGESGLAPTLSWEGSTNLVDAKILWPAPRRIDIMGLQSFGYEGQILLPLDITPGDPTKPIALALSADVMVCHDICIPQNLKLSLALAPDETYSRLFARARENLPATEGNLALDIKSVVLGPDAVVVNAWSGAGFDGADVFVENDSLPIFAKPEITVDEKERRSALIRIAKPQGTNNLATALAGKSVTITLTAGGKAFEKKVQF